MQNEDSIEAQLKENRLYAEKNNITIVAEYIDEAYSGKTDQRPDFQRMIDDAKQKKFDIIICHKVDRFGRNREHAIVYKSMLRKKYKVSVVYSGQKIDNSPEGRVLEGILEVLSQYYSENLAAETMKTLNLHAQKGLFCGGHIPLGYDVLDKKYVINPIEAEVVKKMFRMYADGVSMPKIAEYLNANGYTNKEGEPFATSSITTILHNEKYIGKYIYNKAMPRSEEYNRSRTRPESEWTIVENSTPTIIDKDLWERVKYMCDKNKSARGQNNAREPYLLSGIFFCGECGAKMNGQSKLNLKNPRHYYRCSSQCGLKYVDKHFVEDKVIQAVIETYFDDNTFQVLVEKINEGVFNIRKEISSIVADNSNERKRITKEINNIVNAIARGICTPTLEQKLLDLERKKASLLDDKETISNEPIAKITSEEVRRFLDTHKDNFSSKDIAAIKPIISVYVERVDVFADDIKIKLSLSNDLFSNNQSRVCDAFKP